MTANATHRPTSAALGGPAASSAGLALRSATKRYGAETVFTDLDLTVDNGSFTVLVGPSGCGKSTCLRALAGLEALDAGQVLIDGVDVTRLPARARGLSMVFQDFALYPHMTVEQNVTFALRLQARHSRRGAGPDRAEIRRRCAEALTLLELDGLEQRRPAELSGGQRQRTALARAIVRRPRAFLMDEPLSNLDAQLRGQTRTQLARLHRRLGTTFLYVTHDQVEAMSMATRLVVLNRGEIVQAGAPEDVYERPVDTFVARFIGSPPMNLATASVTGRGDVSGDGLSGRIEAAGAAGQVTIGWRPAVATSDSTPGVDVTGRVDVVENVGEDRLVTALTPGGTAFAALLKPGTHPGVGAEITVRVPASGLHVFDHRTGRRLPAPG
ncbi:ABC transporter ATP-binding protein [Cryptosporangium aurantiacum]|uniref:Carbohydrate ABC transporter ATP-binding protein, CUT1 family n=1 Tax=Cryptosporangium aurantiacum TaxID=134849 RepID=A0A1M7RM76_9ACTN|nr:ABC transporter ATP-binding protein [Cryptosporangium aurantiacum]SHN47299.1 carbohydrate ABC transporter ATP-binding protein, CUT1 family [Cryptosporangium aurantiacum]